MAETLEKIISNNFLLIFFAIVVFIMMYKPKFLEGFATTYEECVNECNYKRAGKSLCLSICNKKYPKTTTSVSDSATPVSDSATPVSDSATPVSDSV